MGRIKALFVSEDHGRHIIGHKAFDDGLLTGLEGRTDVEVRFLSVGRARLGGRILTHAIPLLHRADLDFHHLRWFVLHGLRTRRLIDAELARFPADVVHVNTHAITLGAPPVAPGVPLLVSADSTVWDWRAMSRSVPVRRHSRRLYSVSRSLERRALRRANTVFAFTEWARERLQAAAPEANVHRLSPGVDLAYYRPAPRRQRERHRLLFVGGRFAEKGGEDLLAAIGHRLGVDVELDIVTAETAPAPPGVRVHRLGRSDPELLELLQQADLFCLPTHADTMSFATMEALACGTPAVTSSLAGVPEVVGDAGETVPPGDVRRLREAIDALLADADRRTELRRVARARAEERFDARRQSSLLLDAVYEAGRGPRPVDRSERSQGTAA
jgi:alpha-maltose-1-phosphate synthase